MKGCLLALVSIFVLTACPQTRGRNQVASVVPGKVSVAYTCDLARLGLAFESIGEVRALYLTWLDATSQASVRVLVSDDRFNEHASAVTLVVDKERHRVDQLRDREGRALQFDLKSRFMTADEALAQVHSRVGQMLLESAPLALTGLPDGRDKGEFRFDALSLEVSRMEAIPKVGDYGPVPGVVRLANVPVCEFLGYLKGEGAG